MRKEISSSFVVIVPHIDESLSFKKFTDVKDIVKDISLRKCLEVAKEHYDDLVIAADTVVVLGNEIIGKPKDKEDAYKILRELSGKEHHVYTGYALKQGDKLVQGVAKSTVLFNELSDELINAYIASGSPMDKAGAYGMQDNAQFSIVKKTSGSNNNIIGFPTEQILEDLKNFSL
ncbi:MAG: septum formation protein Maf [Bacilli bacterium]|nr:septum formation protein Maf [Bacilli bacterium]